MPSPCQLPCPCPSACASTCLPHCAMVDLDACSRQDVHPCPEQTFPVDPCVCQGAATCLDVCSQVGDTCPHPLVPIPGDACCLEHTAALDSCAPLCAGACVCPAVIPCDSPQSKGGTSFPFQPTASLVELCTPETAGSCAETFPLQHPISPVDPCIPETYMETSSIQKPTSWMDPCTLETAGTCVEIFPIHHISPTEELCLPETDGTCMENIPLQYPISAVEPCTIEVLETDTEEPCSAQGVITIQPCPDQCSDLCTSQSVVCTEPRVTQSSTEPTGTCTPQSTVELGTAQAIAGPADTSSTKDTSKGHPPPRAPFRLNTSTAAIVERCLCRCQNWLRGKK